MTYDDAILKLFNIIEDYLSNTDMDMSEKMSFLDHISSGFDIDPIENEVKKMYTYCSSCHKWHPKESFKTEFGEEEKLEFTGDCWESKYERVTYYYIYRVCSKCGQKKIIEQKFNFI